MGLSMRAAWPVVPALSSLISATGLLQEEFSFQPVECIRVHAGQVRGTGTAG